MELWLAAVGSAAVAVHLQSSGIERPFVFLLLFFAMRRITLYICIPKALILLVHNNCALYMLLYKQQWRGFYYCTVDVLEIAPKIINYRSSWRFQ